MNGLAEVIKTAVIWSEEAFGELEKGVEGVLKFLEDTRLDVPGRGLIILLLLLRLKLIN